MGRRIFITVAEVSGDKHASELIAALRRIDPDVTIEALGGPQMAAAGAKIHFETTHGAAMTVHAIARVREVWRLLRWTRQHFTMQPPDLAICVDSPAMNFHFAKLAHSFGIPVMYYIAPQVWAWREGRVRKLREWVNHVACILPFEEQYFRSHGVRATFVGHPLFDELPPDRDTGAAHLADLSSRAPVVGLLGGSRASEASANFRPMLEVAALISSRFRGAEFLSPTTAATHLIVTREVARSGLNVSVSLDRFDDMVRRCDLCITVSGTAALHVAGWGVPMIVVYRGNPILWHLIGRWIVKTRTYSLVNLLADAHDHIVPEYIPWYGSANPVADHAIDLLSDPRKLRKQHDALRRLTRTLDRPGASMNAARLALDMIRGGATTVLAPPGAGDKSDAASSV